MSTNESGAVAPQARPAPPISVKQLTGAFAAYYAGSLVVLMGSVFGFRQLSEDRDGRATSRDPISAFTEWDGQWYTQIANKGYDYQPEKRSSVAFFPLYPLLGRAVAFVTGLRTELALLITAHVFLLACCIALHQYIRLSPSRTASNLPAYALIAFAFWPTTFFFRMAYSESVFVFLCIVALYGMECRWSMWCIAAVCGLATAARPVGVALLLPLVAYYWKEYRARSSVVALAVRGVAVCWIACWGLILYMLYQQAAFGDALGFAKTQQHWTMREVATEQKITSLLLLEPLSSVYIAESPGHWTKNSLVDPPFNLHAANPIYFVLALLLLTYGARSRVLTFSEVLLSVGLILIPYVTRSYEMCMASQGRFVAAVFPTYIVLGEILRRIPEPWSTLVVGPAAFLMAAYAALFAAGFALI